VYAELESLSGLEPRAFLHALAALVRFDVVETADMLGWAPAHDLLPLARALKRELRPAARTGRRAGIGCAGSVRYRAARMSLHSPAAPFGAGLACAPTFRPISPSWKSPFARWMPVELSSSRTTRAAKAVSRSRFSASTRIESEAVKIVKLHALRCHSGGCERYSPCAPAEQEW